MKGKGPNQDPRYWWKESARFWDDARKSIKGNCSRELSCDLLNGAIERALKALLAEKGSLTEREQKHGLTYLCRVAGLTDRLPSNLREYVETTSGLHSAATYPGEFSDFEIWCNDDNFKWLLIESKNMYDYLRSLSVFAKAKNGANDEGENNGSH